MSDLSHSNGIYSSLSESSPALGRQGGTHATFGLDHSSLLPSQDQYHDIRPSSPYSLAQSPASLPPLPRQQPLVSGLMYPDSGMAMGGHGLAAPGANGPSSDLSTGSSGGYPEFPASPASWLDEVDHSQFWSPETSRNVGNFNSFITSCMDWLVGTDCLLIILKSHERSQSIRNKIQNV